MHKVNRTTGVAVFLSLFLGGVGAAQAQCGNGYCANDDSPVLGGYYSETKTTRECYRYHGGNAQGLSQCDEYGPTVQTEEITSTFGAVSSGGCPANTARISMPNGYQANNGQFYKGGDMTYVCAKSDTYDD